MAPRTLAIGFAPPNSIISIHVSTSPDVWMSKDSGNAGYAAFQIDDSLGDSDIKIEVVGYEPYVTHFKFKNNRDNAAEPKPLNQQVNVGSDIPSPTVKVKLSSLRVDGRNFINTNGQRTVLIGADGFMAFEDYLERETFLDEFLYQLHTLRFDTIRTLMMGSIKQNTVMDLFPQNITNFYSKVHDFAKRVNSRGFTLLAEVFVDNQDIRLGPEHLIEMDKALMGTNTILSYGNEFFKNGWDPNWLSDLIDKHEFPLCPVWTKGSGLSDDLVYPGGAPCVSFHQRRDYPKYITDAAASPIEMYDRFGDVVILMDEPIKFTDDGGSLHDKSSGTLGNPEDAFTIASIYRGLVGLAVFHNYNGQRGQLLSTKLVDCGAAWVEGLRL